MISIALINHSLDLFAHSILFGRLILAYVEGKRYNTDIICTVVQEKWYNLLELGLLAR